MSKNILSAFFGLLFVVLFSNIASAQDVNDVAEAITDSVRVVPSLIAGLCYLSGIVMAIWALTKTIDHVNNPMQTPIRMPVVRFLVGGALFSLPIVIEAANITINGGNFTNFSPQTEIANAAGGILGSISALLSLGTNFNGLLANIVDATDLLPSLVAAVAYMLGLLTVVSALYKVRDHIDDPMRVTLKEPVVRFLTGGALFAMPTIFEAMYNTMVGGLGFGGTISSIISGVSFLYSTETTNTCLSLSVIGFGGGTDLGDVICNTLLNTAALPTFLTSFSYLFGLILGVWAVLKLRDHALNPSQTSLWEGVSRFLAGGAFFALPAMVIVVKESFLNLGLTAAGSTVTNTGFQENLACGGATPTYSLDQAMGCLMEDLLGPTHVLLNFFCFAAGTIFIMIGISRLTKSAQEGPKGPGGIGTVTTFAIGGILISATTILRAASSTLFGSTLTTTFANLSYTGAMSAAETEAAYNIISAILKFMIIIGMISFVRGLFIIRDVAEGNQQASTMAAVTHIVGGALAVNLGPLLNAVQATLGITAFGISFGA